MDENNTIQYVPQIDNSELKRGLEEARAMWQQMVKDVERSGNHMQNIWKDLFKNVASDSITQTLKDINANILKTGGGAKQLGTSFGAMQSSGINAITGIGAALKTNAIGLALTIITTAINAVVNAVRKANEVSRELEKTIDSGIAGVEKETIELDLLYGRLKQAEKGTKEYEEAKKAIVSAYGSELKALGNENGAVMDLTESYDGLRAAIVGAANARAYQETVSKAAELESNEFSESYDELEKILQKKFKKDPSEVGRYMAEIVPVLRGAPMTDEARAMINEFTEMTILPGVFTVENPIQNLVRNMDKVRKDTGAKIQRSADKFNIGAEIEISAKVDVAIESIDGFDDLLPADKIKIKEEQLEKVRSELAKVQAVIDEETAKFPKEIEIPLKVEITGEQPQQPKQYGWQPPSFGVHQAQANVLQSKEAAIVADIETIKAEDSKGKELSEEEKRLEDEAKRKREQLERDKEALAKLTTDLARESADIEAQSKIDAMEEGYKKIKAQNDEKLRLRLRDIDDEAQQIIEAKQKTLPDGEVATLTDEENSQFEKMRKAAREENKRQNEAAKDAEIKLEQDKARELIEQYGSYQQKREQIAEAGKDKVKELEAERDKKLAQEGISEKEANEIIKSYDQIIQGVEKSTVEGLRSIDNEYDKFSQELEDLFENTSKKSTDELKSIATRAQAIFDALKNKDFEAYQAAEGNSENAWTKEQFDIHAGDDKYLDKTAAGIGNINRQVFESQNAFKRLGEAIKEAFNGEDKKQAFKDAADAINEISGYATALGDSISSVFSSFGNEEASSLASDITDLVGGVGQTGGGIARLAAGDLSGIKDVLQGITKTIESVINLSDRVNENAIEALQGQYDSLSDTLDELDDKIKRIRKLQDESYSTDKQKLIDEETEALKEKNKALEDQNRIIDEKIDEENDKKNTDESRVEGWEKDKDANNDVIEENNRQIEENKKRRIDAIYGEDVQQAIQNFAQAYADAWSQGIPSKDGLKKAVMDMIKAAVMELLMSSEALQNAINYLREVLIPMWLADGVIDEEELDELDKFVGDVADDMDAQYGKLIDRLYGGSGQRSSASQGIAQASQDSIDALFGVVTNIENNVYGIYELMKLQTMPTEGHELTGIYDSLITPFQSMSEAIVTTQQIQQSNTNTILGHLSAIHNNTNRLEQIETYLLSANNTLTDVRDGINQINGR